jgi:hypothetical protein
MQRTGDATTVSVHVPNAVNTAAGAKMCACPTPRSGQRALADRESSGTKIRTSLRFDAALLTRVSESAKRQGITRTSWLHRAAFDALSHSRTKS